jgi:hypothetical protein
MESPHIATTSLLWDQCKECGINEVSEEGPRNVGTLLSDVEIQSDPFDHSNGRDVK